MCSMVLQRIKVSEIGLLFAQSVLFPFLKRGQTCSFFHSVGTVPLSSENGTTREVSWLSCFQAICTLKDA